MKGLVIGGLVGGVSGVVIGILIGALVFAGFGFLQSGGTNIPYDQNHVNIASKISIFDTTDGVALTCRHAQTGPAAMHPYAPLDTFTARETYTQSVWFWCLDDDVDITMTIWGPGNDGETYYLEFGRHMGNAAEIKGFGYTATWEQGTTEGYAGWAITL
jgi:hypothetical protein